MAKAEGVGEPTLLLLLRQLVDEGNLPEPHRGRIEDEVVDVVDERDAPSRAALAHGRQPVAPLGTELISCKQQVCDGQKVNAIVISFVTELIIGMNTDDSTGNHPAPDGKFYGYGSWEEVLEWLGEPDNLSQEGAQNLLVQTIGAVYRAVVERAESLEDWRRSELWWRSHRLLLGRERRDDDPDWLAVLEQQLVQCGALLWQQRIGIDSEAQHRALGLFERLVELIHPSPPWVLFGLRGTQTAGCGDAAAESGCRPF